MGNTMRALDGQGRSVAISVDDNIAGVRRQLSAGVTIAGPLPLPVEVVPPEPIEFLEIIEHVEGAVWAAWPANVVSWSVTCEVGTVVLTGVTAAGGDTTLHAVDDVGAGISSEEFHTVDHPTSVDATAGRALITILYRP